MLRFNCIHKKKLQLLKHRIVKSEARSWFKRIFEIWKSKKLKKIEVLKATGWKSNPQLKVLSFKRFTRTSC